MNKKVRPEWQKYLLKEKCTVEDAMNKFSDILDFYKDHKMRFDANMILNPEKLNKSYRLSEEEKATYIQKFNNKGFAICDCPKIIKCMDAIYHFLNVSKDEAEMITDYAAKNRLTLTQATKDKMNVDFNEIKEFLDTVCEQVLSVCLKNKEIAKQELIQEINKISKK